MVIYAHMSKQYTPAQKRAIAAKKKAVARPRVVAYSRPRMNEIRPTATRKHVRGHGDYKSSTGYQIGKEIGGALGYGAQHLLKFLTGFGDYRVTQNSLMGGVYDPPELRNLRDRGVVVRHREYIADITAASAFTIQSYPINPGIVGSFPWLAQVAEAFEEYYITGMVYEFKTLSADYTTASSAALGFVIMATQYNVYNPSFPDKKTMENYEFSNSGKPSESFIHPIECKRSITPVSELYIRTGAVPSGADQRLYDMGSFQIATGGNSGSGVLGELWVTFEIVLCKPKLVEAIGYELATDHFVLTGMDQTHPLGNITGAKSQSGSNLGCIVAPTTITFPSTITNGTYMIVFTAQGSSTSVVVPTLTYSGCSALSVWNAGASSQFSTANSTIVGEMINVVIKITAASAVVTFPTSGTYLISPTNADLWVTQVNGAIIT